MKLNAAAIRLSATDLSNHLACRHLTTLDLQVARGEKQAPAWAAPDLAVIQELGKQHEAAYLDYFAKRKGISVTNLAGIKSETTLIEETLRLMSRGAEIIAQGALTDAKWFGRPDVLRRVAKPSPNWPWSYEVADTKLASETKAGTILQISLYSELLAKAQGCEPEMMWVIPPGNNFEGEHYRVAEYAAYFRYVKRRLEEAVQSGATCATYPEPVPHCDVCRWFRECDARRRADDHLSLVAGIRRDQRNQLEAWDTDTMAKLAVLPIPLKKRPDRGSREAIEHVREQARVQVQGRTENKPVHEMILPVVGGMGLCRLPQPSPNDLFLDFEGDPFVGESGLQYLFGFAFRNPSGQLCYEKRWALNPHQEKTAFEWLVDEIVSRLNVDSRMHVYHFGAYEPSTLKRLTGLHATREDAIDRLLRARALVDLHRSFKQGVRASLEEYSLKKIELFYEFVRKTPLDQSRLAMRYIEHRLELGRDEEVLPDAIREVMEGYNSEDCFSAAGLRDWLEQQRGRLEKDRTAVPRLQEKSGEPTDRLKAKLDKAAALTALLCLEIPADPLARSPEQSAQWLLAQLLSWHRREERREWQEGFRLAEMSDEELLDERDRTHQIALCQKTRLPAARYPPIATRLIHKRPTRESAKASTSATTNSEK